MNRLQKKCFIASAGTHLLLALILLVGPAFLSAKSPRMDDMPLLDIIPSKTVDALVAPGGGTPPPRQQTPTPPAVPPAVQTKPAPTPQDPDPPKVVEKQESDSLEVKKDHKRLPQVSIKLVTKTRPRQTEKQTTKSDYQEREATNRQREAVNRVLANMGSASSSAATIHISDGWGNSGASYANFFQVVKSVYTRNWNVPDGASDGAVISVSVTIARNGDVVSSRITHRSGDAIADSSVEILLDRVHYVAPLPEDSKEDQRTVQIDFSVRAAKRLLG
jgi:outer membrane biosynthesis protein TonB